MRLESRWKTANSGDWSGVFPTHSWTHHATQPAPSGSETGQSSKAEKEVSMRTEKAGKHTLCIHNL